MLLVVGGLSCASRRPDPATDHPLPPRPPRLVLAVTDATGALVEQARYRAYGEIRGRFDGGGTPVAESERYRHEYTAWETDVGTSLLYAGARYYDPALGQFLTHDPAVQFASPYALGPGDPVNTADPTGAEAEGAGEEVDDEPIPENAEGDQETAVDSVKTGEGETQTGESLRSSAGGDDKPISQGKGKLETGWSTEKTTDLVQTNFRTQKWPYGKPKTLGPIALEEDSHRLEIGFTNSDDSFLGRLRSTLGLKSDIEYSVSLYDSAGKRLDSVGGRVTEVIPPGETWVIPIDAQGPGSIRAWGKNNAVYGPYYHFGVR